MHEGDSSLLPAKDAGLHAILVFNIETWGRYVLNVTLNQTSKKKKTRSEPFALDPLDPLNFRVIKKSKTNESEEQQEASSSADASCDMCLYVLT